MLVSVIFENEDFIVIDKENNLSTQENNDYLDSLEKRLKDLGDPFLSLPRSGIVHRLDKDTTGVLLVAKKLSSLEYLKNLFKEQKIRKTYISLHKGKPSTMSGQITMLLKKSFSRGKQVKMKNSFFDGKFIKIFFNLLDSNDLYSLIETIPITGRTHQIRVALQNIDLPIYNDPLYGDNDSKDSIGQYLHAYSLDFNFKGKNFYFFSQIPHFFSEKLRDFKIKFDDTKLQNRKAKFA